MAKSANNSASNRYEIEEIIISAVGIVGGLYVLKDSPWNTWAIYFVIFACLVILLEIRRIVEAIRFMVAYEFNKKIDEDFARKLDEPD
jgi:hypothetical protein